MSSKATGHSASWLGRLLWWGALLAPLVAAQVIIATALLRRGGPPLNVDDAVHAVAAAAVWHDLCGRDLRALALDLWDQARWPPMGSLLQLPALAALGVREEAHRLGVLLWLLPTGACLAAVAAALAGSLPSHFPPYLAAAWAVLFLVSSQTALVAASSVLMEIPGLAAMLGAYWVASGGWGPRKSWRWGMAGGLLAACWFLKWQYGLVASLALALPLLFFRPAALPSRAAQAAVLFGPPLALLAAWLASPYHLREFAMYLTWHPLSAGTLVDSTRALLAQFAAAPVAQQAWWGVTILGCLLSLPLLRCPLGMALAVHLAVAALGSLAKAFSPRTALWLAGPGWALAATGLGWLCAQAVPKRGLRWVAAGVTVAALVTGVVKSTQVSQLLTASPRLRGDGCRSEAAAVAAQVPLGARLTTVGGWWRFISPAHLRWHVLRTHWKQRFALRDLPVCEWPALEWEPWRVRWPSPRALWSLRRPAPRPTRVRQPPDYVAAFYLPAGNPAVQQRLEEIRTRFVLAAYWQASYPWGSRVVLYRCLGRRAQP
jgi:hypothetical protein